LRRLLAAANILDRGVNSVIVAVGVLPATNRPLDFVAVGTI
jgi:hypothetical protein